MDIAVIGGGLSGCTAARVLAELGNRVHIYEADSLIGGMCQTYHTPDGRIYERYGSKVFHTKIKAVWDFVNRFASFNDYVHRKAIIIGSDCYKFPLSRDTIDRKFPARLRSQILAELHQSKKINHIRKTNFEEAVIDMIGPTLYNLIIYNYTKNQWGVEPKELEASWAPKRIEIREDFDDRLFRDQYQGLPIHGYTIMCRRMIDHPNINLSTNFCIDAHKIDSICKSYDLVMSSAPLDEIIDYRILPYRGAQFLFDFDLNQRIQWELLDCGTINFSRGAALRKINYGIMHQMSSGPIAIQVGEGVGRYYPVHTKKGLEAFSDLLDEVCRTNIIPIGRLGSFRYLDMDQAIFTAMKISTWANGWLAHEPGVRRQLWLKIFGG